jgi:hypothetical protein
MTHGVLPGRPPAVLPKERIEVVHAFGIVWLVWRMGRIVAAYLAR